MKNILSSLYNNDIEESTDFQSKETDKALKDYVQKEEAFTKLLSEELRKAYINLTLEECLPNSCLCEDAFINGFKLAVKIITEALR